MLNSQLQLEIVHNPTERTKVREILLAKIALIKGIEIAGSWGAGTQHFGIDNSGSFFSYSDVDLRFRKERFELSKKSKHELIAEVLKVFETSFPILPRVSIRSTDDFKHLWDVGFFARNDISSDKFLFFWLTINGLEVVFDLMNLSSKYTSKDIRVYVLAKFLLKQHYNFMLINNHVGDLCYIKSAHSISKSINKDIGRWLIGEKLYGSTENKYLTYESSFHLIKNNIIQRLDGEKLKERYGKLIQSIFDSCIFNQCLDFDLIEKSLNDFSKIDELNVVITHAMKKIKNQIVSI